MQQYVLELTVIMDISFDRICEMHDFMYVTLRECGAFIGTLTVHVWHANTHTA